MRRRSNRISGCVNFPIDDQDWVNSNEGGMVVKLVVCDNRDFDQQFAMCSGAYVTDIMSETFIGDDRRPKPKPPNDYGFVEALQAEQNAYLNWEAYHYPRIANESDGVVVDRFISRPYLAAIVMGTTGWSGWNEKEERTWECRYDDLTEGGKQLYHLIQQQYAGCDLHLLTFLDT